MDFSAYYARRIWKEIPGSSSSVEDLIRKGWEHHTGKHGRTSGPPDYDAAQRCYARATAETSHGFLLLGLLSLDRADLLIGRDRDTRIKQGRAWITTAATAGNKLAQDVLKDLDRRDFYPPSPEQITANATKKAFGVSLDIRYDKIDSRPSHPAVAPQQQDGMGDPIQIINKLVALVPKAERPAFKAKLLTDFESAGGVVVRGDNGLAAPVSTRSAKAKRRVKEAKPTLTLARLEAAYEVLVRESDLANPKLSENERLRRAMHLSKTYDRLRRRNPAFHDNAEQLRLARSLLNSRNYQRRKTTALISPLQT